MPKRCCFYAFHFSAGAQLYPTVLKYFPAGKALSDGYFRRWLHLYQCFCKILLSGRRLLHFRPYFLCYVAVCPGAGYAAENPHTLHYGSGWNRLNHCSKQDLGGYHSLLTSILPYCLQAAASGRHTRQCLLPKTAQTRLKPESQYHTQQQDCMKINYKKTKTIRKDIDMPAFKSKAIKTELYRKAVHLSSLWMPLFIFTAPRNWSILLFSPCLPPICLLSMRLINERPLSVCCLKRCLSKRWETGKSAILPLRRADRFIFWLQRLPFQSALHQKRQLRPCALCWLPIPTLPCAADFGAVSVFTTVNLRRGRLPFLSAP